MLIRAGLGRRALLRGVDLGLKLLKLLLLVRVSPADIAIGCLGPVLMAGRVRVNMTDNYRNALIYIDIPNIQPANFPSLQGIFLKSGALRLFNQMV